MRTVKPTYLYLRKKHFTIEANRYLALVVLREGEEPALFMIPSSQWANPQAPFSSRDYEGLKSDAEYGLNLSPEILQQLEPFRFRGISLGLMSSSSPRPRTCGSG